MKTQRELILHYWGTIHDMCTAYNEKHGTDINPWECVKCGGPFYDHPKFDAPTEVYEFAVAILEGKPLFVGDIVFLKDDGSKHQVGGYKPEVVLWDKFTWTPPAPKRTFTLNGVELPCPVKHRGYEVMIHENRFFFESEDDRSKVMARIIHKLCEARDKP